ncbi:IS5 family transposase [Natronococcus sp. JC468]|uniref:IS5 family transposase n=1 Tax=Natronococcus sp. JC468 TaxID=1961921 RepID=UPI001438D912|nr:IS5 family transposase [Natronococcus sp. JC468]NKE37265.1 IS5 family transposase [Natronococcus sp. JC468]
MVSLRRLARLCRDLAKQHVDDPGVPAAPSGADRYADWVQIALILFHVELEKSHRETEDYLNEMPGVLAVFDLDEAPHYSSFCRWEQRYRMRELRRLLRTSAEQAGWSGEAAIDASGFQRNQTSFHYRDRANYSLQSLKTTILIDVNSLAIKDVHYTTQKAWDGHIGMQVFRRNAEDLRVLSADANYSWSDLREECRSESTHPLIRHREQTLLQKAHNARMDATDYNQRWMSETGFSQLKKDDGEKLRSRSWHGQFRDLTRKCIVHNLTQAAS